MAPPFWQETGRGFASRAHRVTAAAVPRGVALGMRREIERVLATMRAR
jgi:hypothetical protein